MLNMHILKTLTAFFFVFFSPLKCKILFSCRFYKGIVPLWGRQIPYTMMKFACFERTVELLYKHIVPKPRSECSKPEQLVVTFAAGYIGKFYNLKIFLCK